MEDVNDLCPTTTFEAAKAGTEGDQKTGVHGKHGKKLEAMMKKKKKGKGWKQRWIIVQGGSMVHDSYPTLTYCEAKEKGGERKILGIISLKAAEIKGPPAEADGKPCFTLVAHEYHKPGDGGGPGSTKSTAEFYFLAESWIVVTDWVRAILAFQQGTTAEPEPEVETLTGNLIVRNLTAEAYNAAMYVNNHLEEPVLLRVSTVYEVKGDATFNIPVNIPDTFGTPYVVLAPVDEDDLPAEMSVEDFLETPLHFDASFASGEDAFDDVVVMEVDGKVQAIDALSFTLQYPDLKDKVSVRPMEAPETGTSSLAVASAYTAELRKESPAGFWFSPYDFSQSVKYMKMKKASGENSSPNYAFVPAADNLTFGPEGAAPEPEADDDDDTITLAIVGDVMPMNGELAPFADPRLKAVFERADVCFVNIEAPVCHVAKIAEMDMLAGGGANCSFDIALDFIKEALVNVGAVPEKTIATLANNHAGDMGMAGMGIEITRKNLNSIGLTVVGLAGVGPLPGMLTKMQVKGVTIGVVAWTRWMNNNERLRDLPVWRQEDVAAVDWASVKSSEKVDFLLGYPHWGFEQSYVPDVQDTKLAAKLLGAGGFDFICGHGPHVLQPVEVREGGGAVCYSAGNLCSMRGKWQTKLGGIVEVTIKKGKLGAYRVHSYVQKQEGGIIPTMLVPIEDVPDTLSLDFLTNPKMDAERVCALYGAAKDVFVHRMEKLFFMNRRATQSFTGGHIYKVTVFTGRDTGAGTDEFIYATLIGDKGQTVETRLQRPGVDCFEAHSRDQFYIMEANDIGVIQQIRIRMVCRKLSRFDRFMAHGSWQLDRIVVLRLTDNEKKVFIVKDWIECKGDDDTVWESAPPVESYYGRSKEDGLLYTSAKSVTEKTLDRFLKPEYMEMLGTGDMIMFSARSFMSIFTKYFTGSNYSHAAVVVKDENGEAFLYESTKNADKTPDIGFTFDYLGMHAFRLEERLSSASGDLIWLRLEKKLDPTQESKLRNFARECHRKRIGYSKWKTVICGLTHLDLVDGNEEENFNEELGIQEDNDPEMFCSEFAMKCLKVAGVAPDSNAAEATPLAVTILPIWKEPVNLKDLPEDITTATAEHAFWD